jgi:hypothetical protein
MKDRSISRLALVLAIFALALELQQRTSFNRMVIQISEQRELNFTRQLAVPLNKSRQMMGEQPVNPTNYAEFFLAFLQSTAEVMNGSLENTNAPGTNELPTRN